MKAFDTCCCVTDIVLNNSQFGTSMTLMYLCDLSHRYRMWASYGFIRWLTVDRCHKIKEERYGMMFSRDSQLDLNWEQSSMFMDIIINLKALISSVFKGLMTLFFCRSHVVFCLFNHDFFLNA